MTTDTAVHNIERYVMMLESGQPTKASRERYNYAMGHLKTLANYMHFGNYDSWGKHEDYCKAHEEERGADITPLSEVLKAARKGIKEDTNAYI